MTDYFAKRLAEIATLSKRAQELYHEMQSLDAEGLHFEHDEGMTWAREYDALLAVARAAKEWYDPYDTPPEEAFDQQVRLRRQIGEALAALEGVSEDS